MTEYTEFEGRAIRAAREDKGYTQQQVAAFLDAKRGTVTMWERPGRVRLQGRFARRLIKLLGMAP